MSSRRRYGSTPPLPTCTSTLGVAYTEQGRTAEAIQEYQTALRLYPDYRDARLNLGAAHAQQGNTSEAVREYQAALRINPDDAQGTLQPGSDIHATRSHR